jgi:hypothetical protein
MNPSSILTLCFFLCLLFVLYFHCFQKFIYFMNMLFIFLFYELCWILCILRFFIIFSVIHNIQFMRKTSLEGLSNNVFKMLLKLKKKMDLSIFSLMCNYYHGHYQPTSPSFTSSSCMAFIHFLFTLDEVHLL